jgi:hypothetical protein
LQLNICRVWELLGGCCFGSSVRLLHRSTIAQRVGPCALVEQCRACQNSCEASATPARWLQTNAQCMNGMMSLHSTLPSLPSRLWSDTGSSCTTSNVQLSSQIGPCALPGRSGPPHTIATGCCSYTVATLQRHCSYTCSFGRGVL